MYQNWMAAGIQYILIRVIIQKLSISKNDTSSIDLPGWAIFKELILCVALAAGPIFSSIRPDGRILRILENIDPAELGQYHQVFAQLDQCCKILLS